MTSSLTPLRPSRLTRSQQATNQNLKCVLLTLGELTLALPMKAVSKVIPMPKVYSSGLYAVGVTSVGDIELTIVDLHQQLFQVPLKFLGDKRGYLVIVSTPNQDWLGIPVAETPSILDIPIAAIRQLPDAYRRSDTLFMASHLARVPWEETTTASELRKGNPQGQQQSGQQSGGQQSGGQQSGGQQSDRTIFLLDVSCLVGH